MDFECEEAFVALKNHLSQAHLLSKSGLKEFLQFYLVISIGATSVVLVRTKRSW